MLSGMRRAILLLVGTILVEFVVAPIGSRVFDYYVSKDSGVRLMIPDIAFYEWGYATVFVLGVVLGIAFYKWRIKRRQTWRHEATLTLVFDSHLQSETPERQDGVLYYYWHHIPYFKVDYEAKTVTPGIGYVLIFLSLEKPTFTNYNRIRTRDGGVICELLSSHPAGAVVRANGDMRGRTLEIRFSKQPIPLN